MSNLDEARYGRACLLVLNICPFALRRVISDYYTQQGSLSIQDFLEKKKHDLFHLLRTRCCCRPQQSRTTPMNNSQWDSLYMRNISSCRRGQRGDCPCQYDAKPGITTSVMDITLCCLFIKNICPGITINIAHVDTIREVRNNLIHAGSASLNEPTFLHYWNRVENAVIDIALRVSPTLHLDTKKMVKDLENQLMNTAELAEELKRLIVDEKRIEDLEESVSDITDDFVRMTVNLNQTTQKVTEVENVFNQKFTHVEGCMNQTAQKVTHIEGHVNQTTKKMTQIEESVNQTTQKMTQIEESVNQTTQKMTQIEESVNQTTQKMTQIEESVNQTTQKMTQIEESVNQTTQKMTHIEDRVDQTTQKMAQIEESVNQTTQKMTHIEDRVNQATQKMTQIEESVHQSNHEVKRNISQLESAVVDQGRDIRGIQQHQFGPIQEELFDKEQNISKLMHKLIQVNGDTAKVIPISPLQERGDDEMPIELVYASVVIREDLMYLEKGSNSLQQNKNVTDPADIFIKDGNLAENIYMLGDAAHGKTTYCIWLLKKWCDAQQTDGMGSNELDKWGKVLKRFDFVFLLQFRNVNPNRASVIDMICQDVFRKEEDFHAIIRYVLSSEKYRSLIIMDGLDEWKPNDETSKQLTYKGMPNIEGLASSVSCFISMRPWVFPTILKMVKVSEKVIEICGLSEAGMETIIKNVLLYHYNLKEDPLKYTTTYNKIVKHLQKKSLKSFMKIPLLAVVCVQIWYEGKQVGDSMVSFYAVMLNMLIERAYQKHELQIEHSKAIDCILPKIVSENEYIEEFISVLLKLGKVAYKGLLSKETNLVFRKRLFEKEIGVRELQFALDVGLISQKEAPSLITRNVSVHFFHKSIQEFLAVIYIVTKKEVSDSFCKHVSNVQVIMELSNVIMFICGMCPSLGSAISQHVVSVTDSDTEICSYRESPLSFEDNSTVTELYKLQVSWYRELKCGQTDSPVTQEDSPVTQTDSPLTQTDSPLTQTDSPLTFHVSDVFLSFNSDIETVRVTRELLSSHHVDIRSLRLWHVPTNRERGITNSVLGDFLSNIHSTRSLVWLYINSDNADRYVPTLCVPTLRCLQLGNVRINTDLGGNVCPPLLTEMSQLRVVRMYDVNLSEGGLGLSYDMVDIEMIELWHVNMSAAGWGEFILSVSYIQHRFNVVLHNTNIDDISVTMIRSSPDFTVIRDYVGRYGRYVLEFTRVCPLSQLIQ